MYATIYLRGSCLIWMPVSENSTPKKLAVTVLGNTTPLQQPIRFVRITLSMKVNYDMYCKQEDL